MPYGRSYRKKAKKAFSKYATKRVAKRLGKKLVGRVIPGYGQYQTAKDVSMAGRYVYRQIKKSQINIKDDSKDNLKLSNSRTSRKGKGKRYGIDDFY